MRKKFNVTGVCVKDKHYMADTSAKISKIRRMIDDGSYFTINRARQYGKTTTLSLLRRTLSDVYTVASISFEGLGDEAFESPESFSAALLTSIRNALKSEAVDSVYASRWAAADIKDFQQLSAHITKMCEGRKVVLMIDEVDKTSNNRIYLHFLGMLRDKFLLREDGRDHTFQSVILAGVYDIKNIKLKMINEGVHEPTQSEGKLYNSPWNIAADFDVDMSFDPDEIASMLKAYEYDHHIGMDVSQLSHEIHRFTSGYPFLVSRICKHIDEKLDRDWSMEGVQNAVKIILKEDNTLFDDMFKNLEIYKDLYDLVYDILITGRQRTFSGDNPTLRLGIMFGMIKRDDHNVTIENKIFEMRICEYFISKDESKNSRRQITGVLQYDIVENGRFNMELCLQKFAGHYQEIFNLNDSEDIKFLERHGRMLFLSYLRPLINGQGFYHIESQFTDLRRMDLVVDYGIDQFIIELKVWHGNTHHEAAYEQLLGYMESKNADAGYLLTFDFRKGQNKEDKAEWVQVGDKRIFDVIV